MSSLALFLFCIISGNVEWNAVYPENRFICAENMALPPPFAQIPNPSTGCTFFPLGWASKIVLLTVLRALLRKEENRNKPVWPASVSMQSYKTSRVSLQR